MTYQDYERKHRELIGRDKVAKYILKEVSRNPKGLELHDLAYAVRRTCKKKEPELSLFIWQAIVESERAGLIILKRIDDRGNGKYFPLQKT